MQLPWWRSCASWLKICPKRNIPPNRSFKHSFVSFPMLESNGSTCFPCISSSCERLLQITRQILNKRNERFEICPCLHPMTGTGIHHGHLLAAAALCLAYLLRPKRPKLLLLGRWEWRCSCSCDDIFQALWHDKKKKTNNTYYHES